MVLVVFLKKYFSQIVFPKVVISYATHTAHFVFIHFFVVDIFETEKHERARRNFKIERNITYSVKTEKLKTRKVSALNILKRIYQECVGDSAKFITT
jgi:hypothetical protein